MNAVCKSEAKKHLAERHVAGVKLFSVFSINPSILGNLKHTHWTHGGCFCNVSTHGPYLSHVVVPFSSYADFIISLCLCCFCSNPILFLYLCFQPASRQCVQPTKWLSSISGVFPAAIICQAQREREMVGWIGMQAIEKKTERSDQGGSTEGSMWY